MDGAHGIREVAIYRVWDFVRSYAVLIVLGAALALAWANVDPGSYARVFHAPLWFGSNFGLDIAHWTASLGPAAQHIQIGDVERVVTLQYLIAQAGLALFVAMAAKEAWEAVALGSGALRGAKAVVPLAATAGGIVVPVGLYLALAAMAGPATIAALGPGWAVPVAGDIALAYVLGRAVFGAGHPGLRLLLLLVIVDDMAGLVLMVLSQPETLVAPGWLLLSLAASLGAFVLFNAGPRRLDRGKQDRPNSTWVRRRLGVWPYVIAGVLSWLGFARAGLPPVLGLVPVIPAIPHADRAFGLFSEAESYLRDPLNRLQHGLRRPAEGAVFLFALSHAGMSFGAPGAASLVVLGATVIGKPLGIVVFGLAAARLTGLGLPAGLGLRELIGLGLAASAGFTVALVTAQETLAPEAIGAVSAGVLLSGVAAAGLLWLGRLSGLWKRPEGIGGD